jgi:proliferating cell nuclear antigen
MQSMDTSHVCLVHFELKSEGFDHFRCDRPQTIGINLVNMAKILKCAGNNDIITMKAEDDGDALTLMFESEKNDRISDFSLKLMTIDCEQLGIPEQEYSVSAKIPANEYQRIMRDLASIGDNTMISATKDGIKFSTAGDIGAANMTLRHSNSADKADEHVVIELQDPVAQSFALRYLNNFAKATPLASSVKLGLSKDVPLVVEFIIPDVGGLKFYLAPKIDDEEEMNQD